VLLSRQSHAIATPPSVPTVPGRERRTAQETHETKANFNVSATRFTGLLAISLRTWKTYESPERPTPPA